MTLLSIQVLALIVAKPIPKLTRVSSIHKLLANAIAKACRYNLLVTDNWRQQRPQNFGYQSIDQFIRQ